MAGGMTHASSDSLAVALMIVFVVAAATKARDRRGFTSTLVAYGLPAGRLTAAMAIAVPGLEIIATTSVVIAPRAGAAAIAAILSIFTIAGMVSLKRGARPSCGCFSLTAAPQLGVWTFGRNATLLAASVAIVVVGDATIAWSLPVVLAATALAACVLIVEQLAAFVEQAPARLRIVEAS